MAREKGQNTKDFRFPLNAGMKPDSFGEVIPVLDTNNVVMLPDGSAMVPREGSEIRRCDEVGFGSDRKVIYFIADPPDIDYGDMIVLTNTKDGRNDVQATEVVRTTVTRSEQNPLPMPELPVANTVAFTASEDNANFDESVVIPTVVTGNISISASWEATLHWSDSSGSDSTSWGSGTVTGTSGSPGSITLDSVPSGTYGTFTTWIIIDLKEPVTSGSYIVAPSTIQVDIQSE